MSPYYTNMYRRDKGDMERIKTIILAVGGVVLFALATMLLPAQPVAHAGPLDDSDGDGVLDGVDRDDDNDGISDCAEKGISSNLSETFVVNSDASFVGNNSEIQLTPDVRDKRGQTWSRSRADFSSSFVLRMQAYLGATDNEGADGIAIVFHDDPGGTNAVGAPGRGIGAQGIQNGIVLELDTFNNFNDTNPGPLQEDIEADHGHIWRSVDQSSLSTTNPLPNLEDSAWHDVVITWDKDTGELSYTVDGQAAGSYTDPNIIDNIFGGQKNPYFGYTASTGWFKNVQKIRFANICDDLPLVLDSDDDGIPNHLDLDSDNDGCLDAIEGGGAFTPANLVNASGTVEVGAGSAAPNQNLGNNVNAEGFPTIAGSGQTIGLSEDASQKDAACCTISLSPDSASGTHGTAFSVPNVLANDTVNGSTPTIGSGLEEVSIAQTGNWPAGITLDTATGAVNVAGSVQSDTYTVDYEVCVNGVTPALCRTETVTITVDSVAINADDDGGVVISSAAGGQAIPNVLANDTLDGNPVNLADVNLTQVSTTNPGVTLDPATGAVNAAPGTPSGTYTVEYRICQKTDPTNCDTATATVTVNDPPVANDDTASTEVGVPVDIEVLDNDNDSDGSIAPGSVTIVSQPQHGTLTVDTSTGVVRYEPDPGYFGTDSFQYTVEDDTTAVSNPATVTITINTNDSPVITTHDATIRQGDPLDLLSLVDSITDTEDGSIDINATNVTIDDGGFDPNVPGVYTITYTVTDSDGNTTTETAQVTVDAPPTITATDTEIVKGDTLDLLSLATANDPEDGTITGSITVTDDGGFDNNTPGVYTITYEVTDSAGNTATTTAQVKVKYANVFDPPSARKTVSGNGDPEMEWKMVWINDGNALAVNTQVLDPIPAGTTYTAGSISCDARGTSTTDVCTYDAAENRVRWEGNIAPDPGGTNEADSDNEVVITFKTTVPADVDSVENQAQAYYDQDADGDFQNDKDNGQVAVLSDDANAGNGADDATLWTRPGSDPADPADPADLAQTGSPLEAIAILGASLVVIGAVGVVSSRRQTA